MPPGNNFVLNVAVPLESVALPMPPFTEVGASKEMSPVGVPEVEVTVTAAATDVPCGIVTVEVPPLIVRAVVVVWKLPTARGHCVFRLVTFTEPRPVAKSNPVAAAHAGVVTEPVLTRTPVPVVLLLQFGEFPTQGTELFPLVTSLNAHVEPERASVEELQLCPDVAAIL